VEDENHLKSWVDRLEVRGKEFSIFREPDIGNEVTSLAMVDEGKLFAKLKLL
jgi:hypothetical protein